MSIIFMNLHYHRKKSFCFTTRQVLSKRLSWYQSFRDIIVTVPGPSPRDSLLHRDKFMSKKEIIMEEMEVISTKLKKVMHVFKVNIKDKYLFLHS